MAPEVWKQQVHRHSDQYSLAATYVEMRLGRRVFAGKNPFDVAEQHIRATPELSPMPAAEQAVLLRALAKEPEKRFPSCGAFATALKEATAPPKETAPQPVGRVKTMAAVLAMVLTAALLVVGVVLTRQGGNSPTTGSGPDPTKVVDWLPEGWEPEEGTSVVESPHTKKRYYQRLVKKVGDQTVVLVVVPQKDQEDPRTFYIMENKVWNDVYAEFMRDPAAKELFKKYSSRDGCADVVGGDWKSGARANDPPNMALGVEGKWARVPAFRMKVTEAHCFAEWLGKGLGDTGIARLPSDVQWMKAAGKGEDMRVGPFDGSADDLNGIAVRLGQGPWPIDKGERDVSKYGCRQMAGNGYEWTRTLHHCPDEIPLKEMPRRICYMFVVSQSYDGTSLKTFEEMKKPMAIKVTEAKPDIGFRVVIEQP
jgi:formylglycine-generating enzyme required for sulfatase activity